MFALQYFFNRSAFLQPQLKKKERLCVLTRLWSPQLHLSVSTVVIMHNLLPCNSPSAL